MRYHETPVAGVILVIFNVHDDVIKWEHFPRYLPFVRVIHWCLMSSLICTWTSGWANNWDTSDLRYHCAHYDITLMIQWCLNHQWFNCLIKNLFSLTIKKIWNLHILCEGHPLLTGGFPLQWASNVILFACYGISWKWIAGNYILLIWFNFCWRSFLWIGALDLKMVNWKLNCVSLN